MADELDKSAEKGKGIIDEFGKALKSNLKEDNSS